MSTKVKKVVSGDVIDSFDKSVLDKSVMSKSILNVDSAAVKRQIASMTAADEGGVRTLRNPKDIQSDADLVAGMVVVHRMGTIFGRAFNSITLDNLFSQLDQRGMQSYLYRVCTSKKANPDRFDLINAKLLKFVGKHETKLDMCEAAARKLWNDVLVYDGRRVLVLVPVLDVNSLAANITVEKVLDMFKDAIWERKVNTESIRHLAHSAGTMRNDWIRVLRTVFSPNAQDSIPKIMVKHFKGKSFEGMFQFVTELLPEKMSYTGVNARDVVKVLLSDEVGAKRIYPLPYKYKDETRDLRKIACQMVFLVLRALQVREAARSGAQADDDEVTQATEEYVDAGADEDDGDEVDQASSEEVQVMTL